MALACSRPMPKVMTPPNRIAAQTALDLRYLITTQTMIAKMPMAEVIKIEKTPFSRKVRRSVFGIDLHGWEHLMLLALAATGLVAIAVALTTTSVVILQRHETAEAKRELEEYKITAESKVAEAGKSAGDALLRAADLEKQAEQLRKDTAEANARAVEAQLALERFKAPRTLSTEQQSAIAEKLKPWANMPVSFGVSDGAETVSLLAQIRKVVVDAGWSPTASQLGDIEINGAGLGYGIAVETQVALEAASGSIAAGAAKALSEALNAHGIQTKAVINRLLKNPAAVNVFVGTKP